MHAPESADELELSDDEESLDVELEFEDDAGEDDTEDEGAADDDDAPGSDCPHEATMSIMAAAAVTAPHRCQIVDLGG